MCIIMYNVGDDCTYKRLSCLYEEIQNVRRNMEASATSGSTMKSTNAWGNLMKSYHLDVKVNDMFQGRYQILYN